MPRWLYPSLTTATIVGYWLPRLFRGFWVDETGAFWIAHNGFGQVWHQMQIYPGQSIIYGHLTSLFASSGPYKEALLRLPSVAGALIAAWLLYKLTEAIAGPGSGFLAVIPFCCAGPIIQTATNARPYALGMAVMLASFWSLRQWVHTRRTGPLIVFCLCSPIVVYFHYLFAMIFLVQMVYLVVARRSGRTFPWTPVLLAGLGIAAGALPLVWQFQTIVHLSGMWKAAALPTTATFLSIYPLPALLVVMIGMLAFRLLYPKWFNHFRPLPPDDFVLLLTWLLLGPALIFAGVRMTGLALFATRYLIYALLPVFILVGWAIRQMDDERGRFVLIAAVSLNAALCIPALRESEWRTPLALAREIAGADTPLLVRSGFVESSSLDLRGEPKPSSYLFAPLTAYPVQNKVIPVPFFVSPSSEQLIEEAVLHLELSHRQFCLVATTGSDVFDLLPAWFHKQGYRSSAHETSGFTILLFDWTS